MPSNVSTDVLWATIRKNSSFLRRQRGVPKHFSREAFNPKGVNSIRYNGLVHKKGVDIRPSKDGKGIEVRIKNTHQLATPAKAVTSVEVKKDARHTLKSVRRLVKNYRRSHQQVAVRRASQLYRSIKPRKSRKTAPKTEA